MVCRHFPQLNDIALGKNKAENERNFALLEAMLDELTTDRELMATVEEKVKNQVAD